MGTGYTRNDTANNIADGNVINASDLDGEFDAVQAAFNGTTGHSHDGTSGEGPQIDTAGIADSAVTTAKINDANVTTAKIADSSVTTAKIANSNVTLAKMAANSVDSDQYVDGSIDTAHIANDAVTGDKLANNIQIAGTLGVTGETTLSTHLNMGDNDTIKLGASADLQIYHNGSNSYVKDSGAGYLILGNSDVGTAIQNGSNNNLLLTSANDIKLGYNNSFKLATTSTGIDVTGEVQGDSLDIDGAADISGVLTLHNNLDMQDGDVIRIGTSDDLKITHNGSNSLIDHDGSGHLYIRQLTTDADIYIQNDNGSGGETNYIQCDGSAGTVLLHYYGSQKLITKSDGVDIIGELQSDSLDVDGNADISGSLTLGSHLNMGDSDIIKLGNGADLQIYHNGTDGRIHNEVTGRLILRNNVTDQDVELQTDDGSGGLATYVLCDGSNGQVYLNYYGTNKLNTKSDGVNIAGEIQATSLDINGSGNISGTLTMGGNIDLQDSDIIKLGSGDDMQLYHNSTHSYIDNVAANNLYIRNTVNDKDIILQTDNGSGGTTAYVQCDGSNGEVRLYHYGTEKLNTSSSGVTVAGTVTATAFSGDGSGLTGLSGGITTTTGSPDYFGIRAFINFDGKGTVNIRNDQGFSSLTDNGTGRYTASFSTSFPDVNYTATTGMSRLNGGHQSGETNRHCQIAQFNTGSILIDTSFSQTFDDLEVICVMITR